MLIMDLMKLLGGQARIIYATLPEETETVCQKILSTGIKAVGFDIEWYITYKCGAATPMPATEAAARWKELLHCASNNCLISEGKCVMLQAG
jgi:hypothetical protein